MTTTIDLSTLTDAELSQRIGAAVLDHAPNLSALEAERQRRLAAIAHTRLADTERDRRAKAGAEAEGARLFAALKQQLGDLDQQHRADLADLDVTPPGQAYAVVERAYRSGRAAYSLAHDLYGATGDRAFQRAYRVPDALSLHGGAAGDAFLRCRSAGVRRSCPHPGNVTSSACARSCHVTRCRRSRNGSRFMSGTSAISRQVKERRV